MASPPEFESLQLRRSIIPYDDLQISPGYGRILLTPDDVPPILALPWALGPVVPRVNRAQDDGSLNVFVTGGSGGATTPQGRSINDSAVFILTGEFSPLLFGNPLATALVGVSASLYLETAGTTHAALVGLEVADLPVWEEFVPIGPNAMSAVVKQQFSPPIAITPGDGFLAKLFGNFFDNSISMGVSAWWLT